MISEVIRNMAFIVINVILGEKTGRCRHRLELQIVPRGIFEEHSPLFSGMTLFGQTDTDRIDKE